MFSHHEWSCHFQVRQFIKVTNSGISSSSTLSFLKLASNILIKPKVCSFPFGQIVLFTCIRTPDFSNLIFQSNFSFSWIRLLACGQPLFKENCLIFHMLLYTFVQSFVHLRRPYTYMYSILDTNFSNQS